MPTSSPRSLPPKSLPLDQASDCPNNDINFRLLLTQQQPRSQQFHLQKAMYGNHPNVCFLLLDCRSEQSILYNFTSSLVLVLKTTARSTPRARVATRSRTICLYHGRTIMQIIPWQLKALNPTTVVHQLISNLPKVGISFGSTIP